MIASIALFAMLLQQPAPTGAQLTATEKTALDALGSAAKQLAAAQKEFAEKLHAVEEDIKAAHPGFQFDEKTGQLVPVKK